MKKLLSLITFVILTLSIVSCKKDEPEIKTYNVECIVSHSALQPTAFDIGIYSFEVYDENNNRIWSKNGGVTDSTIYYYTTAKSGQKITSFCGLLLSTSSTNSICSTTVNIDGNPIIELSSSDSSYISVYDLRTIDGKEYIVKEIKLP